MPAQLTLRELGGLPWWIVTGSAAEAFQLIGEHAADRIRSVVEGMDEVEVLRRRTSTPEGAALHRAVLEATRSQYSRSWSALEAMAEGADVALNDLVLLNLRADLGTDDGLGCTDICYMSQDSALLAHNEDGTPALDGQCVLLSLALDGEIPLTVWWYPGFIPSNTFAVTGNGMVWSLDAVQVPAPPPAPGRHFVAWEALGQSTFDAATQYLTTHASAGGFVYNIAQTGTDDPRISVIEAAAGSAHRVDADPSQPSLIWHSNHLRWLSGIDQSYQNTLDRADFLAAIQLPEKPDTEWALSILADYPLPHGVLRDDAGSTPGNPGASTTSVTLCTMVADLYRRELVLKPRRLEPVTVSFADLVVSC